MGQHFTLVGRASSEVELKYSQGGAAICKFSVACDRYNAKKLKDEGKQSADFFSCVAFGKQAEFLANNLKKGKLVEVHGEVNIDVVQKDGSNQYYTKVVCSKVQVLEYQKKEEVAETYEQNNDFQVIEDEEDVPF